MHRTLIGLSAVLAAAAASSCSRAAHAIEAPAGETGQEQQLRKPPEQVEVEYLRFIIDHHFSALRMTELAAGTDESRDAELSPEEGTSPSPGFRSTPARAKDPAIRSMARAANRMQREEIHHARELLKKWYSLEHQPRLPAEAAENISALESAGEGDAFERAFLKTFSRHHLGAVTSSTQCLTGRVLEHDELHRYCEGVLGMQLREIDEMRHKLCSDYGECDFVPAK